MGGGQLACHRTDLPMDNTAAGIERFYREEFGRILATLIRVLGDFDLAEDAVQDAFASAVEQWHRDGLPENPRAWVIGVARHKAIDRLRRQTRFNDRREELIRMAESGDDDGEMRMDLMMKNEDRISHENDS